MLLLKAVVGREGKEEVVGEGGEGVWVMGDGWKVERKLD